MDISVVGTGYVGLVSGVCLAEKGHGVICVDIDADKVDRINAGDSPIHEEGLDELLERNVGNGLSATTDLADAVARTSLTIIAVGTPFDGSTIDVSYIEAASEAIGKALRNKNDFHTVVVKSTVVPGTTDDVVLPILEKVTGKVAGRDFGVSMNPEFLREGAAIGDFMDPDRIVYGGTDERALGFMDELYAVFPDADKVRTTNKTAEMIKYTANSLLATMISFSNEMGNLCASLGDIDIVNVMRGVHLDRRVSPIMENGDRVVPGIATYLEAGCGFGGSCFPKDVKALIAHGEAAGEGMNILKSVVDLNKAQPLLLIDLLRKHFDTLQGRKIAVLGLAFKPGTDDMRESPSIPIIKALHEAKATITAYDPIAAEEAQKLFADIPMHYADTVVDAVKGVDAILLVTRWEEFADLPVIINGMDVAPLLVDGRRMIDKDAVPRYEGIGLSGANADDRLAEAS
jgi:UDPglucose 6-dehydrogenase/GDP-mannose 6-dehydrogenase